MVQRDLSENQEYNCVDNLPTLHLISQQINREDSRKDAAVKFARLLLLR